MEMQYKKEKEEADQLLEQQRLVRKCLIYFNMYFVDGVIKPCISKMLEPQDSFGRFVKIFLDLQKVDHTIGKHH